MVINPEFTLNILKDWETLPVNNSTILSEEQIDSIEKVPVHIVHYRGCAVVWINFIQLCAFTT